MWEWLIPVLIVVVLLVLVGVYLWASYRSLVQLNARVDEAWNDITVQLSHRAEAVNSLVDAVREYAPHERVVLAQAADASAEASTTLTPAQAGIVEGKLQRTVVPLFQAAEAYPQLHSSHNFLQLQQSIAEVEDKIHASRRFYNGGVRELNTKMNVFPASMFARRLGMNSREFFEVVGGANVSEPPRVQF
ncbi:LemA protein [Microbacterium endophyticum]|uniref:LemA protein n=1 Tax=Microbacterium endophyticum TaxID=1526412 RepID=A0A7W4YM88_9MICO|nr:LemA family protein [Microbacterium endophyticum]MBB2974857.1 LemA protein [Microbacterium endophyticum]NIK37154.1 LemA protein [Microbacterium endophyticum]